MEDSASPERMARDQDERISEVVEREQSRLLGFIRKRVPDPRDAEDILQEVFVELVEANRLLMPIDHVTGWLFRVGGIASSISSARRSPERLRDAASATGRTRCWGWKELLPSPADGPEALYARTVLLDELELALDELPEEQRSVRGPRAGRAELPGAGGRERREREHPALAKTIRGAAPARAIEEHVRRDRERVGVSWDRDG